MSTNADMLTIAEAATVAGVTPDTVRQYERYGLLSAVGGVETYRRSDVCSLFHVLERAKAEVSPTAEPAPITNEQTAQSSSSTQARGATDELLEINQLLRIQIQIMREERDWLRERVEKLEERSEREQMLLLAESQTVRSLLAKEQRQRRWAFALPWFKSQPA